ncbi:hypothetical protein DLD99_03360 [Pseudomonas kribbensis]|uniref:Uncharacterized protein n=1 Tax=Pseudomonas kribbensis TaxID=1628086 RepID=A0A345RJS8_9PSED|nr:hypothetical protein [Pseudomonas kribbensis]AXI59544.1 hypothetical protein DLD99_03360 [Pseudomonas kribbensis]
MELEVEGAKAGNKVLDGESSSVLNSNLLAFFAGLSRQDKQYVKDSMRWAEYQADLRSDRKRTPVTWFEFYSGVLWSVGWGLEQDPVIVVDKHFSGGLLDSWASSLSTLLSREKIRRMRETFQLLEYHPAGMELFAQSTREWGDFRFFPAQYNRHSELEIVISNVRLLSSNWASKYLFWDLEYAKSQLDIQARRFVITPRAMDKYRANLTEAVKDLRQREIELM